MNLEPAQRSLQDNHLHPMRGNELLLLNDPQKLWIVQSGSLAVFTVHLINGEVEGDRRYLFSVLPQGVLFGAAPPSDGTHLAFIAVALEPTELTGLRLPHPTLADALEHWFHQLGQMSGLPRPQAQTLLPQTQYLSLEKGQVYQPSINQIVWVTIQQGHAYWMGYQNLLLSRDARQFPLSDVLWLEAAEHLELFTQPVSEIEGDCLLQGVTQFNLSLLQSIDLHLAPVHLAYVFSSARWTKCTAIPSESSRDRARST